MNRLLKPFKKLPQLIKEFRNSLDKNKYDCKNITNPENIKLIRIPAYAPELNPAEKVWQWMKDKVAMKFFKSTKILQNKITEMVGQLTPDPVK